MHTRSAQYTGAQHTGWHRALRAAAITTAEALAAAADCPGGTGWCVAPQKLQRSQAADYYDLRTASLAGERCLLYWLQAVSPSVQVWAWTPERPRMPNHMTFSVMYPSFTAHRGCCCGSRQREERGRTRHDDVAWSGARTCQRGQVQRLSRAIRERPLRRGCRSRPPSGGLVLDRLAAGSSSLHVSALAPRACAMHDKPQALPGTFPHEV